MVGVWGEGLVKAIIMSLLGYKVHQTIDKAPEVLHVYLQSCDPILVNNSGTL